MNALKKCGVIGNQNMKESGLNIKKQHCNNIFINVLMPLKSLSLLYHIYNGFLHGFITLWLSYQLNFNQIYEIPYYWLYHCPWLSFNATLLLHSGPTIYIYIYISTHIYTTNIKSSIVQITTLIFDLIDCVLVKILDIA